MAHIRKLTDKPRALPWLAHIHRKGHKRLIKMFKTKREAEHWAEEQERSIRLAGLPLTTEDLKKHTVGDIVRRYLTEVTPTKGCHVSEAAVLNRFLKHPICSKALAYVNRQDAYQYVNDRLKETWKVKHGKGDPKPITPRTVRREVNSIQHVFETAREQWGFTNLSNPFRGLNIKGSMHRRKRRLKQGELEKLEQACEKCRGLNRYYVQLAIYLAVETGMRLQEIFNLNWDDVDTNARRIEVCKSKTDHVTGSEGRSIVMTCGARDILGTLRHSLSRNNRFQKTDRIFPMTKDAFKQSWKDVLKRAEIAGLTFHDLRREAGSRFDEAGLTKGEHDLMMGHANRDMTSLYIHADLQSIQDKLDRYVFDGLTFDEALEQNGAIVCATGISDKPKAIEWDFLYERMKADGMRFKSKEEMDEYAAELKKFYGKKPSPAPYPPNLGDQAPDKPALARTKFDENFRAKRP
ncbi:MAG TPA: site-specific integrase [Xanthobacteraceae bacterium]|jgi:integrase